MYKDYSLYKINHFSFFFKYYTYFSRKMQIETPLLLTYIVCTMYKKSASNLLIGKLMTHTTPHHPRILRLCELTELTCNLTSHIVHFVIIKQIGSCNLGEGIVLLFLCDNIRSMWWDFRKKKIKINASLSMFMLKWDMFKSYCCSKFE